MTYLDRTLLIGILVEVINSLRLACTETAMTEFHPMVTPTDLASREPKFRRLYVLFIVLLGVSRAEAYRNPASMRLVLYMHLAELVYFYNEYRLISFPTAKMKMMMGVLCVTPLMLFSNMNSEEI